MKINKEEILHIAKLANLNLKENEIDEYILNLQDILNFANILNNINTDKIDESISMQNSYNVFRKDEVVEFKDNLLLLSNAPEKENNMFKIPKVIN